MIKRKRIKSNFLMRFIMPRILEKTSDFSLRMNPWTQEIANNLCAEKYLFLMHPNLKQCSRAFLMAVKV
ncbi:hypothetical protein HY450_02790 [Candidatus Pacearchaeota archaeon]|nr:hypothetical protein [Candidatus Pacearchaeota archaeon]